MAPTTPQQGLPFWKTFVAGGGAGIVEILTMYPTDIAKTRQQLSSGGKHMGMIAILQDIIKNEGAWNLYRGVASPILAEAPKRAIKFSCNEKYKDLVRAPDGALPGWRAALAGAMAGCTECTVNTPFETVKVRMQAKENLGRYTGVIQCATSIVQEEGVWGLYRGLEAQLWRNAVWNGMYFGMIGSIKAYLVPEGDHSLSRSTLLMYDFGAGVVGGTLATLANTPFDVIKSRMQNQTKVAGQPPKYQWTLPSLVTVAQEEGFAALYKGIGPRLVRLGPGGGIMLVAFNAIMDLLKDV